MAYSSNFLKDKITILSRQASYSDAFGRQGGDFEAVKVIHANVSWTKGVKAMREGALDAYDTIMVRCRWCSTLTRECRIKHKGIVYAIDSFHDDYEANEMQITATELK